MPRGESKTCYEAFLKRLGKSYNPNPYEELLNKGLPIYQDIRCGLVHAYALDRDCVVKLCEGKVVFVMMKLGIIMTLTLKRISKTTNTQSMDM